VQIEDWFLTPKQRGNRRTSLPAWCEGSLAIPIIDGVNYFSRLVDEVEALGPGDHLFFTDWRGDPDQLMRDDGPTMVELFRVAAKRGVVVRGLLWRSHLDIGQFSQEENREVSEKVEAAGGEVLLDQRVRRGGSHHQKLVVMRHPDNPERDIAFAGGIDLCHSRRDDSEHRGDRQAVPMSELYGEHPPWHDVQVEIRGPAVGALDASFRERWNDPTSTATRRPIAWLHDLIRGANLDPGPLPPQPPDPPPAGPHAVQVLRTYPATKPRYPFAPDGERSIARGYSKAIKRARRLIYIEDQYMWSIDVARLFARALKANPDLHMVVVVPRHPDVDGSLAMPPNQVGRAQALEVCRRAGGDRVHVFDVENHEGTPVYVHAKVCVVDDVWASIGSDNFNRRSWTHDSELSCAVLDDTRDERAPLDPAGIGDGARVYARDLRLRLMREHLDLAGDESLIDPDDAVKKIEATADALDAWYAGGQVGERPPGRLRRHHPQKLGPLSRLWATPVYKIVYDPDGRPWRKRMRRAW
jgi:phosphatidylserine/phosphatidylglycerophosphate/cardiolipin synthase-like enzyme